MIGLAALLAAHLLAAPAAATAPPAATPAVPAATRRIALLVGANDGGPGRDRLRYAGSDARALAQVLTEVGGVDRRDTFVLLDPDPKQLLAGFARARARVEQARAAGERVQFLFYYSGHADDRGLVLGAAQVDYPQLRRLIREVPAQVHLGLLDSCSSGAFVRTKGGRMRAPLSTADPTIEGHAFLTSSSAEEVAQESDRIGGSFFTHYLVSGLRGAADVDRDRRVTLNEAYRFAFDETLASTETTLGRAQHPVYDIQLVGTGDLVMTDLRETSALLDLRPNLGGRVYVRDAQGRLAAQLYKGIGAGAVSLALEPGPYTVVVDDGTRLHRASLDVRAGAKNELSQADLSPIAPEATTARGGPPLDPARYRVMPVAFGFVAPLTTNLLEKERKVINRFALNLLLGRAARIDGAELALGVNWTEEGVRGVQLSALANAVGGDVRGYQSTAGINLVDGSFHGLQGAATANFLGGDLHGLQAALGLNVLGGHGRGLQATAGVNWARSVDGAQLGVLNLGKEFRGAQLGVFNVASGRVRGAQVGLINYADEADASVALLGMTRKGGVFVDVWTADTAALNLAFKFRAKYTYTLLGLGVHPAGSGRGLMFGAAFGGHVRLPGRFYLDVDLGTWAALPRFDGRSSPALLLTLRALLGARLGKRLAVWGGPSLNVDFDFAGDRPRLGYGYALYREPLGPATARLWPGFAVGLQF